MTKNDHPMKDGLETGCLNGECVQIPDGRELYLYGPWSGSPSWPHLTEPKQKNTAHSRWHPLRQEWVTYAAARQNRTYKPPANSCPLCPHAPGGELPLDAFTIAVFENRFPSFQIQNEFAPDLSSHDLQTKPAKGRCEVVVYCSAHEGNLSSIPQENRELLLKVWGARRQALLTHDEISFVMPFENRGEDAGVTLHHPHGQIYSFEELPPIPARMADSFAKGYSLHNQISKCPEQTVIDTPTASAFVPPFARFPYECWLLPKAFHPAPDHMSEQEIGDMALLLQRMVKLYDTFFKRTCPYVMIVYMAPKGMEDVFPFHIQFYPFLRSTDRLKYLAGCEQGAGSFLVDVLPENAASDLRNAGESLS
ncbi:MAG: galactose-1-phosphate uridylyltransferase [Alphaproteobacteria bacterium]|nr:galactose-1-phosphate uridylyltransferase [Alphaproteobacteria bacterium]